MTGILRSSLANEAALRARLPLMNTCLGTSADPDAVTSVFGKVLAIQGTQKVAETRETDDELVPKIRLEKFAGALHRFPDDGVVWMNEAFIGRYGNR